MKKEINLGLGFVTGRSNVCRIINSYYKDILSQIENYDKKINLTIFILFDTKYQNTPKEEFYKIDVAVLEKVNIKYITPECIKRQIKNLTEKNNIDCKELELFFGHGHAKGRNTIMYYALKYKMDYLLFWDDDEYPVAVLKDHGKNTWIKQNNVLEHIKFIEQNNCDVTVGYHCGYISPIPYIEFNENFTEDDLKQFIEVISNDIISWESIKEKMKNTNGVTYAHMCQAKGIGATEIESDGIGKWIAGSTLCLNLNNIGKIPAFYNPPNARGEDTFFSTALNNSSVFKIPVYHFHDGFLKYTCIMEGIYPKSLRQISVKEASIKDRFFKASLGWIKYKPLLLYIKDKEKYKNEMIEMKSKLKLIIPKLNNIFEDDCFSSLMVELEKYDENVESHYKDYEKTNEIWNCLKNLK